MNVYTLIPSPGSRVPENGGHHSHPVLHQESLQTSSCQTPGHQKVWQHIPCSYNGYPLTKCALSPYPGSPTSLPQSSRHSFHPGVRDSLAVDHWSNKWCENVPLPLSPMRTTPVWLLGLKRQYQSRCNAAVSISIRMQCYTVLLSSHSRNLPDNR